MSMYQNVYAPKCLCTNKLEPKSNQAINPNFKLTVNKESKEQVK